MALTASSSLNIGFQAASFKLLNPASSRIEGFEDHKGANGTLVLFICNHCPYVIHIIDAIVDLANDYKTKGIELIAINSNDINTYPEDAPEKMIEFSKDHAFTFPYLFDESQAVAKAYDAACTPDFYLIDKHGIVVYRGRFDAARPGNGVEVSGKDMRTAIDHMLAGHQPMENQNPSIGCNIKWK
jgi:peroxiredoxin